MLTDPSDIAGIVSTLHSEISQYAGISNAASVPILVTETNSSIDMDTQPAALFGADMYMTWLENGVATVDWWNEHNGEGTVSTVDGATDYGDQGIFSNNSNYRRHGGAAGRHAVRAVLRDRDAVQAGGAGRHHGHRHREPVPAEGPCRPRHVREPQRAHRQRGPVELLRGEPRLQRLHARGDAHRVHAGQQRHVDHQRVGQRQFGHRGTLLADRGPRSRQRRDRRDRARRAGPARRVRPVLVHFVQHVGHRHAHLAGVRGRHLSGGGLPGVPGRRGRQRHAGGDDGHGQRDPDRAHDRDDVHL